MKNVIFLFACFLSSHFLFAEAGVFEGGIIVNGVTYFETGNTFQGKSFSITEGGTLNMTYAYAKTFKNGGWDVCSARMNYAVYPTGGSPSFTVRNLPFGSNLGGGDQQWNATFTVNLASGLTAGTYNIAIYYDATVGVSSGCSSPLSRFLSNGGANYIATLTVNVPLPVQLQSFSAEKTNNDVFLNWATASETNNQYFQVEHQSAGQDWSVLGRINGKGNSSASQHYNFTHRNPANGLHYYRLQQVDLNGKSTYSPITSIDFQSGTKVLLSPNPLSGDQLSIQLPDAETAHQLRLFNLQGQLLKSWSIEAGAATWQNLDVGGVARGLLFLQMDGGVPLQLIRE